MKKLLLLVLVFVTLTGFSNKELEETSGGVIPVNMLLQSSAELPEVGDFVPQDRRVFVVAGERVEFSITYNPIPEQKLN